MSSSKYGSKTAPTPYHQGTVRYNIVISHHTSRTKMVLISDMNIRYQQTSNVGFHPYVKILWPCGGCLMSFHVLFLGGPWNMFFLSENKRVGWHASRTSLICRDGTKLFGEARTAVLNQTAILGAVAKVTCQNQVLVAALTPQKMWLQIAQMIPNDPKWSQM